MRPEGTRTLAAWLAFPKSCRTAHPPPAFPLPPTTTPQASSIPHPSFTPARPQHRALCQLLKASQYTAIARPAPSPCDGYSTRCALLTANDSSNSPCAGWHDGSGSGGGGGRTGVLVRLQELAKFW